MNFITDYQHNLNQWLVYATVDGLPHGEPLGTHATEAEALEQIRVLAAVAPLIVYALREYNRGRAAWMDEAIEAVLAEAQHERR